MSAGFADQTVFLTSVSTPQHMSRVLLLIDSIRSFGGAFRNCPIWVFTPDSQIEPSDTIEVFGAQVIPITVPDTLKDVWFASKVYACAQAETVVNASVRSLVWVSPDTLVIKEPILFGLPPAFDAAVRPVHIRNIGLLAGEPVNDFWNNVYAAVGTEDTQMTVKSFVDTQSIRAYFNSHILSVNPARELFQTWFECFKTLACDREFQESLFKSEIHRIFLHQAVLSALLSTSIHPDRIRILPPDYSYPYNLHKLVPPNRRARVLNDLVCITCEERSLDPGLVDDIIIQEPLRTWLSARVLKI